MLGKLRPDSWLHREVRRKIEEVFLRNDDQAGLVAYYEQWTKKEPEDVEALVRLGRTLAGMGRAAEAHAWYEKAVKLAPTRRDLRLALISQLVQDQKFAEAAIEYQALDQAEPNNPDTLRDWGALVLRDTTKPAPERKAAAAAIWRKMLDRQAERPGHHRPGRRPAAPGRTDRRCLGLYHKATDSHRPIPSIMNTSANTSITSNGPTRPRPPGPRSPTAQPERQEPGPALRSLGRLRILEGSLAALTEAVRLEPDSFDLRLKLAG